MLVLTRKPGERIVIGGCITVKVIAVRGDRVQLGFEAPSGVPIVREEILLRDSPPSLEPAALSPRSESMFYPECA